jgi:hypothetical protein
MKMLTESEFTRAFCAELRTTGAIVEAIVASRMQKSGLPDRYVSSVRWHGWVEFKGIKTPLKIHQADVIFKFHKRKPFSAIVARMKPGGKLLSLRTVETVALKSTEKEFAVIGTAKEFLEVLERFSQNG